MAMVATERNQIRHLGWPGKYYILENARNLVMSSEVESLKHWILGSDLSFQTSVGHQRVTYMVTLLLLGETNKQT